MNEQVFVIDYIFNFRTEEATPNRAHFGLTVN